MKRWLLSILFTVLFLSLGSCYRDYQIDGKDFTPHIVLHGVVQADSLMNLYLSKSWLIGETPADTLSEASISLWVNGEPEDFETATPHSGDHLRLQVEAEDLPSVWAETVVPHRVEIDSIDCQWIDKSAMNVQMKLSFHDPAGIPNYYGLGLYIINDLYGDHFTLDISKEPLFAPMHEYGILDDVVNWADFYYYGNLLPFSGHSIDGQRYTLQIAFKEFLWNDVDDVLICFYTFSESYYAYLLSLLRLGFNVLSDYGLADPNQVYTNVKNGLGIFASYQVDTLHLSLKSLVETGERDTSLVKGRQYIY